MTQTLMNTLLSAASYPHPVSDIRLLETHISWVLLTGDFAYKIKKPVNFGFLDFSTLARRKYCCEEEVRLNSRFSSDLYLEVVPITGSDRDAHIGGEGDVIEYAVKMRQFDQHALLESLASRDALHTQDMQLLAKTLADFHQHRAARLPNGDEQTGSVQASVEAAAENFRQISAHLPDERARAALEKLRHWTEQQSNNLKALFAERREQGFVRECHGDLHLRNIARIDGSMVFFDCIEFNPQLSWIDVQSELAFLLMDMEDKRLHELSNRLLNFYLEYSGDYAGLALLDFYKVYRAMVRAKVMVLKRAGATLSRDEDAKTLLQYETYIRLAQSCCQPRQAFLGIMHGVSGTGKSTVAATLAAQCGAIRIRSDVERKRLFGLDADARTDANSKQEIYSAEASARTFAAMETLADVVLKLGYPVLVDATFIAVQWRQMFMQLASKRQVPFVILECRASPDTIERRLQQRERTQHDASEAGIAVMRSQLDNVQPFLEEEQQYVLAVDTETRVDAEALLALVEQQREAIARS